MPKKLSLRSTMHHFPCPEKDFPTTTRCDGNLVVRVNEVVCQLLDSRRAVPGYHVFVVVRNENSLLSLDDNEAIAILFEWLHKLDTEKGCSLYLSGVKTSVFRLGKNVFHTANVKTI